MKQKMKFSSVFVLAGVLCAFGFAQAAVETDGDIKESKAEIRAEKRAEIEQRANDRKDAIQEKREERQEVREERMEQICKNVEARIRTRINRYENNKKANLNVFSNMVTRLNRVVAKFKELGLETTKLEADIVTLQDKIDALSKIHETFIAGLEETENYACGKSEGEFRDKLGEARSVAPEVRAAVIGIREFYQSTVRPDILELREQTKDGADDEAVEG